MNSEVITTIANSSGLAWFAAAGICTIPIVVRAAIVERRWKPLEIDRGEVVDAEEVVR